MTTEEVQRRSSSKAAIPAARTGESVAANPARSTVWASAVQAGARVLPEHARSHNRALVLQALYRAEGLSRADLSREVGLTRVTISDLIGDLIAENLVIELGIRAGSRPGKPATMLDINRDGFVVIGVDLSYNSLFRGVLTNLDGAVLHREEVDVVGVSGEPAVEAVALILERLVAAATAPILGVGVGSPGIVDSTGTVLSAPNLGWKDLPLQQLLSSRSGLPVQVANDANIAALAERTFGGGGADMMLVRAGRGVGSGLIVGGQQVYGSGFAAGEIGHVVVGTDGGDTCICGKSGCLETWLATPRIEARLADATTEAERDAVLRAAGERLGIATAPIVGALNLGEVVLSGPSELIDGPLLAAFADTLRDRTMPEFVGDISVRMTTLGRDIIVLGAVVMVLTGQLGVY
ncbi:ROK family protein [Demequina aurantiaca]|uniref:ROK family transcriptional regulator n=1 Tax=Demequina aurantiaca TaxID=676200 RepID=UPI003D328230